jgi:hypothetical protein
MCACTPVSARVGIAPRSLADTPNGGGATQAWHLVDGRRRDSQGMVKSQRKRRAQPGGQGLSAVLLDVACVVRAPRLLLASNFRVPLLTQRHTCDALSSAADRWMRQQKAKVRERGALSGMRHFPVAVAVRLPLVLAALRSMQRRRHAARALLTRTRSWATPRSLTARWTWTRRCRLRRVRHRLGCRRRRRRRACWTFKLAFARACAWRRWPRRVWHRCHKVRAAQTTRAMLFCGYL